MTTNTITETVRLEATKAEEAAQHVALTGESYIRRILRKNDWGKDIVVQTGSGWQKMRICGYYTLRTSIMLIARKVNEKGEMQGRGIGIPARKAGITWCVEIEKKLLEDEMRRIREAKG